jgi:HK97 gp10 family phage protein
MKIKVEGLKEIQAVLQDLSKATARNVVKRVLLKRAQPIVEAARTRAPVRAGKLRDSIIAQARGGNAGKAAFAKAMRGGASRAEAGRAAREANRAAGSTVEVVIGPHDGAFYASLVEFGTAHSSPKPFMRPAWDTTKGKLLDGLQDDMWAEVKKAIARHNRKLTKAGKAGS